MFEWPSHVNTDSIVTMDAVFADHYSYASTIRDVKKAYLGFKGVIDW